MIASAAKSKTEINPKSAMQQPRRTRPARLAPPKLGRAGAQVFAGLVRKTKFADPALAENWPTIAGPEIAALCRPGRITGAGAGRTLEVIAPSGAAAAQMQMLADDLKMRVNRYLGPNAVARLAIRQRAGTPHRERPAASGTQPEAEDASPLGRALSSFRAAVKRRNDGK